MLAARFLYSPHVLLFPGTQERGLQKLIAGLDTEALGIVETPAIPWDSITRLVVVDTRPDKRERLRHHHWIVLIATAANMADEPSQAELAYRAGRQLALRGSIFDFTLTATPLNELARRKRRKSTGAH